MSFKKHLSTIKNAFLYFNIHTYTFQIHTKIHILIYILIPSRYIPSRYLPDTYQCLPKSLHTFDIYYNTIIILQYPSIYIHIRWNCLQIFIFRTFLSCHYTISPKLSWRLIILPRCHALAMTSLLESKNQEYSMNPIHLIG
jgi:hypothetical protein